MKKLNVFLLMLIVIASQVFADGSNPLCFTAKNAGAKITFYFPWHSDLVIQTSRTNYGMDWTNYCSGREITLTNVGDKVYFRAASQHNYCFTLFYDYGMANFEFTDSVTASGNIMSLYGPDCPNVQPPYYAFAYMFKGCTTLTTAPELPTTTLASCCYENMFDGCISLTTAPQLPATTLASGCYQNMFKGCTSLTAAPQLPATILADGCYGGMFQGCTSLAAAPQLSATTLVNSCYGSMFNGCTSLTTAPQLPATALAGWCYNSMFKGCTSLTAAPQLPASTLTNSCYEGMFQGCTSLTTAPQLPATALAYCCYTNMFDSCTSLKIAPQLPATSLDYGCYCRMFQNCTSLTRIPQLPATELQHNDCYALMFQGCTSLKVNINPPGELWAVWSNDSISPTALLGMFNGTSGTMNSTPVKNTIYYVDTISVFIVTVNSNDITMGSVTGGGNYCYNDTAIITAIPNAGYKLKNWSNGEIDSVIHVKVVCDTVLTAYFESEGTGVEEVTDENVVTISPNPIRIGDVAYVNIDDFENAIVEVYTLDGILVERIKADSPIVAVDGLNSSGIYLIIVNKNNTEVFKGKVIVR